MFRSTWNWLASFTVLDQAFVMARPDELALRVPCFSRPELLILDEPFIGLDRDGRREMESLAFSAHRVRYRLLIIAAESSLPT